MKKYFVLMLAVIMVACTLPEPGSNVISLKKGWKIQKGDQPEWTDPQFDDSDWISIKTGKPWESQGIDQFIAYDGYAWYRISFLLPEEIRKYSYFGKELQITLGTIDDGDQTYLNGKLLGVNSSLVTGQNTKPGKFEGNAEAYSYFRNYIIPVDDERINWDGRNILAIRVHDHGGFGGMTFPSPSVSMIDIKDFLFLDVTTDPFEMLGNHFTKNIRLVNKHESEDFTGEITIKVFRSSDGDLIYETSERAMVKAGEQYDLIYSFEAEANDSYTIEYIYDIDDAHFPLYKIQVAPEMKIPEWLD